MKKNMKLESFIKKIKKKKTKVARPGCPTHQGS
jgi:hypothetical protein